MQKKNHPRIVKKAGKKTANLKAKKASVKPAQKKSQHRLLKKSPTSNKKVLKAKVVKVSKKELARLSAEKASADAHIEGVKVVETVLSQGLFTDFVTKNVGKLGLDLINNLNKDPHTDDKLAAKMNIKVNEVRRMLNVLNGYGITKYDINKDGKGWLTFRWYLDREKLTTFNNILQEKQNGDGLKLQEDCNDFFYCVNCYKDQKVILPFDSAFETGFKCDCGKSLAVLSKDQATVLFKENTVAE